jgi:hypothetical protein
MTGFRWFDHQRPCMSFSSLKSSRAVVAQCSHVPMPILDGGPNQPSSIPGAGAHHTLTESRILAQDPSLLIVVGKRFRFRLLHLR